MNEYQEELFRAKVQELLVHLKVMNDHAQWSVFELYATMDDYLKSRTTTDAWKA